MHHNNTMIIKNQASSLKIYIWIDEIAEFNKQALDSLRQPLEDGNVTISRVKYTNTLKITLNYSS
ncbi:ATP-binding protein [Clostridium estertheticum]|nr:ATP-binding protein [Clostridium estertheticum]MBZ9688906.1 ATP-binding protein [Clostridium estertheticum]